MRSLCTLRGRRCRPQRRSLPSCNQPGTVGTIACVTLPTCFRGITMLNVFDNAAHRAALRITLSSGTALFGAALLVVDPTPASADQQFLKHGSLVISSSTYDN